MSLHDLHLIKLAIAATAVALVVLLKLTANARSRAVQWGTRAALGVLAVAAIGAYADFGQYPKFGTFRNPHDLFHYYLGSKYSPELGYQNLYPAVVVAARENGGKTAHGYVRRMDNYAFEHSRLITAHAPVYRDLFSPDRWQAFKADVAFFKRIQGARFSGAVRDMGYNATPVWNMIGRAITNRVPATDWGLGCLVALDLALMAISFVTVWRAFGAQTALLALIFFCTCFSMSYTHARGGFLRLDWVAALIMATSALKTSRYKTAGALVGYAAMIRVFPVVFAVGLGGKLVWEMFRKIYPPSVPPARRGEAYPPSVPPVYGGEASGLRHYVHFFLSMAVVCGALLGLSVLLDGTKIWFEFARKIALHDSHIAPVRVGFKYIFLMAHTTPENGWAAFKAAKIAAFHDLRVWWWLIQGGVLAASVYLVRNLEDYETVAYGYVLAFFLTAPTFYYQVMVTVALFLFLPKCDQWPRLIGTVLMFAISIALFVLERYTKLDVRLSFIMSCMLMGLALYMMGLALFARRPAER